MVDGGQVNPHHRDPVMTSHLTGGDGGFVAKIARPPPDVPGFKGDTRDITS